jgi:peptide/nickel transport system substrate-binding protein
MVRVSIPNAADHGARDSLAEQGAAHTPGADKRSGLPMRSRRRFLRMMGGVGGAMLAAGSAPSALAARGHFSSHASGTQEVTLAVFQNPDSLDPAATGLITSGQIISNVFDPLVWRLPINGSQRYYPGLATSFHVSSDATTYTFKLRKGVTFHDGTALDAHAVKVTFDHIVDPATKSRSAAGALGPYKETRILDKYTAQIVFSQPNAAFLEEMTGDTFGITSPTALAKYGSEYGRHPVGTGPFMFKSWVEGQQVTLTANPHYRWGPPPLGNGRPAVLKGLTFRILPDHAAQFNALTTREITIAQNLNPQDVAQVLQNSAFKKYVATSTGMPYSIMVNAQKAPTNDMRVRRALQYAADQQAIVRTLYFGLYEPATSIFTRSTPGYSPSQHMYPHDPKKAGQLLDQAGWKVGANGMRSKGGRPLKLQFINISGFGFDGISQLLQAQFQAVGIQTSISDQSFPAVATTYNNGAHNLADFFYYDVSPYFVRAIFGCDEIKAGFNWEHYCNPALDRMVAQANAIVHNAQRYKLYQTIGNRLMEAAVIIPIYDQRGVYVGPADMKGIVFTLNAIPLFHAVSI